MNVTKNTTFTIELSEDEAKLLSEDLNNPVFTWPDYGLIKSWADVYRTWPAQSGRKIEAGKLYDVMAAALKSSGA